MIWQRLPRDLKILLTSTILANTGGRMIAPFMPLYILALGGSITEVGVYLTVENLSAALLRPLGGWFSDTMGRIQAVAIGAVFSFAGQLGYALSPTWTWLMVAAVVLAFGRALVGPSFRAFTAESAPEGQTAQTFGLVNGLFTICQIVGPALAGWIVARYDLKVMLWTAVLFMGFALVLRIIPAMGLSFSWQTIRLATLRQNFRLLFTSVLAGGLLTWLFVTDSIRDFGIKLYEGLQPILFETNGLDETQIGLIFSFYAIVYLLTSLYGSRLADRWNPVAALAISGVLQGAALILVASYPTPALFGVFFLFSAIAFGLGDPAFDAFLARATPSGQLGLTFGLFSTAISVFSTPAPYLGSLLWAYVSPTAPFWSGAVVMVLAGGVTWWALRPFLIPPQSARVRSRK